MHLPPSAQEFARVIGLELTLKLAEIPDVIAYRRLYVPIKRMDDEHVIPQTIGREAALKLQRNFGGSHMPLHFGALKIHERNKEMVRKWLAGKKPTEVAEEYSVCIETVKRALLKVKLHEVNGTRITPPATWPRVCMPHRPLTRTASYLIHRHDLTYPSPPC